MNPGTQARIARISRYLYIYASMIIAGVLWNIADGEIESIRDFIRGIVRAAVMVYLSRTIWDLKIASWWAVTCASCAFAVFGVVTAGVGLIGGVALASTKLLFIGIIVLPATIMLIQVFYLSMQKDVRQQFKN